MAGSFKIVAENKVGKEEHIFDLRLAPEPEPAKTEELAFLEPLKDLTVNDGNFILKFHKKIGKIIRF